MSIWRVAAFGLAAMLAWRVQAAEPVRIGTEPTYPPFEFKTADGSLKGIDVEVAQAACVKAGLTCEFVTMDFDALIPALAAHKIDAAISQMSVTPERQKVVAFTHAVTTVRGRFVAGKGSGISDDLKSFAGKTVGIQSGTVHENWVNANLKGIAEIHTYQAQDQVFDDLASGRVDATLCDESVAWAWLQKPANSGFAFASQPLKDPAVFGTGTAMAARPEDTALVGKLNEGLAAVMADGTFARINKAYLPFSIAPGQ